MAFAFNGLRARWRAGLQAAEQRSGRGAELLAALLAVALYLPALGYGFVFDDRSLIGEGGMPVALGGWLPYRPLRYASYWMDGWLGGTAAVYHGHNLLLHGAVVALVVALARRLGSGALPALAGGLLVAFHPLAVEAVAYVAGRRDLLCVVFGVAALHSAHRGRTLAGVVLLLLSVASKESGLLFALPLAAMSMGEGRVRGRVRSVAAAALAGVALMSIYGAIGPWHPPFDAEGLALSARVAQHYASGLLAVRALGPEYPGLLLPAQITWTGSAVALALLAALAASVRGCLRARPGDTGPSAAWVAAWIAGGAAALSIYGGLHEPGADRHAYLLLPALGVAFALGLQRASTAIAPARASSAVERPRAGVAIDRMRANAVVVGSRASSAAWRAKRATVARAAMAVAVVALLALLASETRSQMGLWQDERTLWSHAAAGGQASPRAHANLARVMAAGGELESAARQIDRGLAVAPDDPLLYLGRAALRCAQGRPLRARNDLQRAASFGAAAELVADIARDCPLPRETAASQA